ncbi:hypothetical protein ACFQZE_23920 [Paenibacillus sp. GCM10027627]|uniref:hypothetical protein n=1 Tax=unclassified Paenibacillus TaxID=185978 RepID=UPI003637240C
MSKTKVYSTRLIFEEDLDKKAMDILDSLDQEENGTVGFRTTHWIREAVLLRVEMQLFMLKETGSELHPKQYEDLKSWLLHLAEPAEMKEPLDPLQGLDPTHALDEQVVRHLSQMNEEQKQSWMLDAVRMRFAIEHHAPTYFINQYQSRPVANVEAPVTYSEIEDPGLLQEVAAASVEEHIEITPDPEPIPQRTWSPYVIHLRNAMPAFIQQSSLGAIQ